MKKFLAHFSFQPKKLQKKITLFFWRLAPNLTAFYLVHFSRAKISTVTSHLEQSGDFEAALLLVSRRTIIGNQPMISKILYARYLKKLYRVDELKSWYQDNYAALFRDNDTDLIKLFLVEQNRAMLSTLLRVADELQIYGLRTLLLQQALENIDVKVNKIRREVRNILLSNHIYYPMEHQLFEKNRQVNWIEVKPFLDAKKATCDIEKLVSMASHNELLAPDDRKTVEWRVTAGFEPIEFFIPNHYFAKWDIRSGGTRQANWQDIRSMYTQLMRNIEHIGFPVQPRHQYFMNDATPSGTMPAVSFFTHGGGPRQWHMRDVGIQGFFSLDPDGYWGYSSISIENIADRLANMVVSEEEISAAVRQLAILFGENGGNKYAKTSQIKLCSAKVAPKSIFLPLQAPSGLVATHHRVEELIALVAKYSKETRTTAYLRRHPLEKSPFITNAIKKATRRSGCVLSDIPPWELSNCCAATVSLNSATMMQGIVAGRPVFTWGNSDIHSVATDIGDYELFKMNMDAALSMENPLKDLEGRFCYFYIRKYLIHVSDLEAIQKRLQLILTLSSLIRQDEIRSKFLDNLFAS